MDIKCTYRRLTKRIWNPKVYDYSYNLKKAAKNSMKLSLSFESINYNNTPYTSEFKENLINNLIRHIYFTEGLRLEDIALKCTLLSVQLKQLLKVNFNINSEVTTGNVYYNKSPLYYEPFPYLKKRLVNSNSLGTFKGHTWLTLENKDILDITMAPNEYFINFKPGDILKEEEYQKVVWISEGNRNRNGFIYQPLLLGSEYFEKANLNPQYHTFIYSTDE